MSLYCYILEGASGMFVTEIEKKKKGDWATVGGVEV
jgi:hypothetical protein